MATTPAAVAAACQVIFTMLPDAPDVAEVLEGENGVFGALPAGHRHRRLEHDRAGDRAAVRRPRRGAAAASMLDAPVSGGEIGAIDGTLTFMVGGDAGALEAGAADCWARWASPTASCTSAPSGAGQICKACNQIVIGGTMSVVAEAIALSRKAGVDPMKVRAGADGRLRRRAACSKCTASA